jgi:hypothetical protein
VPVRARPLAGGIERDQEGEITRLSGPDPRTVLKAYCDSQPGGLEPLAIVDSVPPDPAGRLGVFRIRRTPDTALAIRIRRDWKTRQWVAGVNTGPIRVFEAPATYSMPVATSDRPEIRTTGVAGTPGG